MKFYNMAISYNGDDGMVEPVAVNVGKWVTRADAEQLERERDLYKFEAEKLTKVIDALVKPEQAAKDAVAMAKETKQLIELLYCEWGKVTAYKENPVWQRAQAIIEKYEGAKG